MRLVKTATACFTGTLPSPVKLSTWTGNGMIAEMLKELFDEMGSGELAVTVPLTATMIG